MSRYSKMRNPLRKLLHDKKGELGKIVTVAIGLFIAGVILPVALTTIASGNYTGVDASVKTVVTVLLPVLAVIAIALIFLPKIRSK